MIEVHEVELPRGPVRRITFVSKTHTVYRLLCIFMLLVGFVYGFGGFSAHGVL